MVFEAVIAGRIVSKILNVPLISSIHDDPLNRLEKKITPMDVSIYRKSFIKTLKYSINTITISDYIKHYENLYDISPITLFPGVEKKDLYQLSRTLKEKNIIIGVIGSISCMLNGNY